MTAKKTAALAEDITKSTAVASKPAAKAAKAAAAPKAAAADADDDKPKRGRKPKAAAAAEPKKAAKAEAEDIDLSDLEADLEGEPEVEVESTESTETTEVTPKAKPLRMNIRKNEMWHEERLKSLEKGLPLPLDDDRARLAGRMAMLVPITVIGCPTSRLMRAISPSIKPT